MSLDFYRTPVDLSDAGVHVGFFEGLPHDAGGLAQVVQGLLVHEHIAPAYGLTLSPEQHAQAHLRSVERILETIAAQDNKPLPVARPAGERVVGVCRHFTLLHVAMLRAQGVAARARCGFGAYFQEGMFLDHWVTEYWNEAQSRWVLVDPQLDTRQRELFKVTFDPVDVPRDQFLVAGDAWRLCRSGKADPASFGILDMHGLWLIAGNVIRDVAALNNHEMLPWDVWGAMAQSDAGLDLPFFDRLAELSHAPDEHLDELHAVYEDKRIAVPGTVFNAVLNRPDPVH